MMDKQRLMGMNLHCRQTIFAFVENKDYWHVKMELDQIFTAINN